MEKTKTRALYQHMFGLDIMLAWNRMAFVSYLCPHTVLLDCMQWGGIAHKETGVLLEGGNGFEEDHQPMSSTQVLLKVQSAD